ncbi:MAG TPA: ABC transporter permease, partial [Gemmatimonadales bacterium]
MRPRTRVPEARTAHDADDEIAFHLESRVAELVRLGQTPEAARRSAEAEFGDVPGARHELEQMDRHLRRRERAAWWAETVIQHLRYAARSLRRSPAFTLTAVVTLAIGIGASVAIFAVVNGVLLRPLPFPEAGRLVGARHDLPPLGMRNLPQAVATYVTYGRLAHSIETIGVYKEGEANVAEPGVVAQPERLAVARISATLLTVLRAAPAMGHAFTTAEDSPGAPPVVLIADGLWRSRFGGDRRVVGRTLDIDGATYAIVGVMPPGFRFPGATTQLWIPFQLDPLNPPPAAFYYTGIARLKPGVSIADAQRDFAAVLPRAPELVPGFVPGLTTQMMMDQMHPVPVLKPLREDITGGIAGTLWTVAAAALLVLLVACANVANLTLVRADARQRELAVREALGAGRARILLHFLAESALLSMLATVLGLGVAQAAVHAFVAASPAGIPRLSEVGIDGPTIGFTIAAALLVALACSALPALRMRGASVATRTGGRSGTAGKAQHRVRGALVTAQIALALVALAGAGLLVRTFQRLHAVRPGFEPGGVSTYWVSLPPSRYKSDTSIVRFYAQLITRVSALPGV